jgi:3-carboxy-cis,cis-muconate cycloisomerase
MAEALSFALAAKIGKHDAHQLLEGASRKALAEKRHLRDVLGEDPRITAHLSAREIEHLFDPLAYQGVSQTFTDRTLAQAKTR